MISINNKFKAENIPAKMILQVHDELVVEVQKSEAEKVKKIMIEEMESGQPISVPIVVEAGIGDNWAECKG
jgi:DNA polymerase-1